ncbi:hypothetical protein ACLQ29_21320 [Micromonospora sp. DT228]|uniref:hypothetical protein n=1 Tax=Micromonospora sp. DT228 TaxID=3393443 RepID=UPI003CEA2287
MNHSRIASAVLILAAATALSACGDGDKATTAGSTSSASTSAAATSAAASPTAAPASSAATGAVGDKQLCTSLKKASDQMKAELVKVAMAGEPSAADFKKVLTALSTELGALATAGGDGKVAAALRPFGAEVAKAAAAADPASAADNPAFMKAGTEVNAACTAAGVPLGL